MTDENNAGTSAPATGGFDFADFELGEAAERGAKLELRNPKTGKVTGVTFEVYGADARSYRTNLRRMRDGVAAAPEREPTDEDDAIMLGRAREAACALMGWYGVVVGGQPVDFSIETAVDLFTDYPWAADQVLAFIGNRGNF